MSYDLYILPSTACTDTHTAGEFINAQADIPGHPIAAAIAREITAQNEPHGNKPHGNEGTFLSLHPLRAFGNCVPMPSPYSAIQRARDVAFEVATAHGYGIHDPQIGVEFDPRLRTAAHIAVAGEGAFPYVTAPATSRFVERINLESPYLVVTSDQDEQNYIQTKLIESSDSEELFTLECRAGGPERHYATHITSRDVLAALIVDWLRGDNTSLSTHRWEKLEL